MTSDGGLLAVRELDERLVFGELIKGHLTDGRGKNTRLPLTDLVRQLVLDMDSTAVPVYGRQEQSVRRVGANEGG